MVDRPGRSDRVRLKSVLQSQAYGYLSRCTHNFYHYPARFAPDVARAVIETFSKPGDWVMDPFMGGGTAVIEGLRLGRRVFGSDANALAHFVASVRTTPLSPQDERAVRNWALDVGRVADVDPRTLELPGIRNLPRSVEAFMATALELADELDLPRRRSFARCVLLRLGQLAFDCRDDVVIRRRRLARRLPDLVDEMLSGMGELVRDCRAVGLQKKSITRSRVLLHRSAVDLLDSAEAHQVRPKLVFTSPPYPGVHVLYHRWQNKGRRESPAPYWIAGILDGHPASYYALGSRTPTGLRNYFNSIRASFRVIHALMPGDALLVQLIGFSDITVQLPLYLQTMRDAGFEEINLPNTSRRARLYRRVPHRKWYARLQGAVDASSELLLVHRPAHSLSSIHANLQDKGRVRA